MTAETVLERLLQERARLVTAASWFKREGTAVKAPERVLTVLANVRDAGLSYGLDAANIEERYRRLIDEYIAWELLCIHRDEGREPRMPVTSLEEIRVRIDAIDRQVVGCLASLEAGAEPTGRTGHHEADALVARVMEILAK